MKDIKIFVSCHKDFYVPKSDILIPVQVGSAMATQKYDGYLQDDTGDNISDRNKSYCELTAHYWAWKNVDADYYGFYHYRRYISFNEEIIGSDPVVATLSYPSDINLELIKNKDSDIRNFVENYDIITTLPRDLKDKTVLEAYGIFPQHFSEDLKICLQIIQEKYPEYYNVAYHYLNSKNIYYCNMFILSKPYFEEYSEWLFGITDEFIKRKDIDSYNTSQYRVVGYLAERLFGIWYSYIKLNRNVRTAEKQRIHFKHQHKMDIEPINTTKPVIPVIMSSSEYFLPFVDVLIHSILANASKDYYYDFIVFNQGYKGKEHVDIIKKTTQSYGDSSVRFLDISPYSEIFDFHTKENIPIQTWFRVIAPYILDKYDKAIYLDCDIIVDDDISKIFNLDISDKIIAATRDMRVISSYYKFPRRKAYCETELTLENINNYFQAGVMVMSFENFRKRFEMDEIIEIASSKKWELVDQDMLNSILSNDDIYYLDQRWDVVTDCDDRCKTWLEELPHKIYDMHIESLKCPAIYHYGGPYKPWSHERIEGFCYFWKYARSSELYEFILMRSISEKTNGKSNKILKKSITEKYVCQKKGLFWNIINSCFPVGSKRRNLIKKITGKGK